MLQMLLPFFYPAAVLLKVGLDLLLSNPNTNPNTHLALTTAPSPLRGPTSTPHAHDRIRTHTASHALPLQRARAPHDV